MSLAELQDGGPRPGLTGIVPRGSSMRKFPEKANIVIVGLGGIVGASVAHHRFIPSTSTKDSATTPASAGLKSRAWATTPGWRRSSAASPQARPLAPGDAGRDQGEIPADRGKHGPGRAVEPRRGAGGAAVTDRGRAAGGKRRKDRPAARFRQYPGAGTGHRGWPHPRRRHSARPIRADIVIVCTGIWGARRRRWRARICR